MRTDCACYTEGGHFFYISVTVAMLLTTLAISIFGVVLVGLVAGAIAIRRRQRALSAQREAALLQRRADHLFKIALAAQVHTRTNNIARALLEEAIRVLEQSLQLDPSAEVAGASLRECHELLVNIGAETAAAPAATPDPILEFPEAELIEAQLHLTEAMRLLVGLEKRGLIDYDTLTEMTAALRQSQRAIDLRLQLRRAAAAIDAGRPSVRVDEAQLGEYLAAQERNRA